MADEAPSGKLTTATNDPSFRASTDKSPILNNEVRSALTGENQPGGFDLSRHSFDVATPAMPTVATADLAKAMDRFVSEFAQPYDTNKDGVFAGKELYALAGAVIDKVGQVAPALVANRETILAAIDRVGSVSTEQLKALIQNAAASADANGDGKVDPSEYQNLLRVTADKTLER